ncbi:MAG: response regulator [Deltaproteobacteria bacterium]|nr:response regulator [Deltaproteobacteria bacterium]
MNRLVHLMPPGSFDRAAFLCGAGAALLALVALLGWILGLPLLASIHPRYIPMAPSTAVSFLLLGAILSIQSRGPLRDSARWLTAGLSALVSASGLIVFGASHVGGAHPIDSLFQPDPGMLGTIPMGRMSPATGAMFFLAGFAMCLLALPGGGKGRDASGSDLAGILGSLIVTAGLTFLLGYLYGKPLLYGGGIIPVALPTAFAFLLQGIGFVAAAGRDRYPLKWLAGPTARARLLRVFLPLSVLAVIAQDLLHGIFPEYFSFSNALASALSAMIFAAVTGIIVSRVALAVGEAMDRSEARRRQAEETLRRSEEQLRQAQKMEAVGRLAGGIAHDFNNLLTAIAGYSTLLLQGVVDDPSRRNIQEIQRASDRAASLTRQLLAFSRRQILQPKVMDLNAVVGAMDDMLRRLIGEDIDLLTVLEPGVRKVKADPGQMEQVIMNLAVNARDAMPEGGKLTIETANVVIDESSVRGHVTMQAGSYVVLALSDTGSGMDPETISHIFEPFFTTKEVGKGTGLGLSTVYGIVKQSGGYIWVYSEPGRGTTFKIYLPQATEEAETAKPAEVRAGLLGGSETILLVEDEDSVRSLVREVLARNGYTVLAARNGEDALRACDGNAGAIHLMLCDVVMPGMSGVELARRIVPLRPEIKVLYMSGYTDTAIVRQGVLDPGTAFLEKPFAPDALARKVREVLDSDNP